MNEQPKIEQQTFEDVKDVSRNTEAPITEKLYKDSINTERNDYMPNTPSTETQNYEQISTTSPNIKNIDDSQKVTNTQTINTELPTESPKADYIRELPNLEVSNTQAPNIESSNTESPNIEKKTNFQSLQGSSILPSNSSLSNKESFNSGTSTQPIKDIDRTINKVINDENNEKPVLTQTKTKNRTKSIERPNIVFIVADDLVKQLFR